MQIYFVRHGKTEWNLERRFQGAHGDSPLLAESLNDIEKLGNHLKGTNFNGIYSSPLKRAFDTEKASQFTGVDDKVLAVSHGAALGAIMGGLLGYPLKDVRCNGPLSNTSLTILETLDQGATFKLIVWNDTSFLERDTSGTDAL